MNSLRFPASSFCPLLPVSTDTTRNWGWIPLCVFCRHAVRRAKHEISVRPIIPGTRSLVNWQKNLQMRPDNLMTWEQKLPYFGQNKRCTVGVVRNFNSMWDIFPWQNLILRCLILGPSSCYFTTATFRPYC